MINKEEDGIKHINVYSAGETELGKLLSNFSKIGFIHPVFGRFISMEGYWYWLKTGKKHHILKTLYGFHAKKIGKGFDVIEIHNFDELILEGIKCKIEQNQDLMDKFKRSTLPFKHYYVYGDKVVDRSDDFQIIFLEEYRKQLQGKKDVK